MVDSSRAVAADLHDYALLFAIPVNREEFDAAMRGEFYGDYMSEFRAIDENESAWETYAPIALSMSNLVSTASALGVKVYTKATLQDITTATARCQTIILMAHFRGWPVSLRDFEGQEESVLAQFRHGHPFLESVPASLQDVVDLLNRAIQSYRLECFFSAELRDATRGSRLLRLTLQRDLLDETLQGSIAPGNLIELADGLHTPGVVEAAMKPSFQGELDLSMCNSEVLATLIDIRRRGLVRHAHFATEIMPLPHALTIRAALLRVAQSGGSYLDERLRLHHSLARLATE